ncbi:hypothetical protein SDC9_195220 [bioreactor metagenome]|uniref:Uncharacterized protein n=1 Tax=bioreactor metagenome TaxID=1076179 RepID=A0A645I8D9_9ZZZZ
MVNTGHFVVHHHGLQPLAIYAANRKQVDAAALKRGGRHRSVVGRGIAAHRGTRRVAHIQRGAPKARHAALKFSAVARGKNVGRAGAHRAVHHNAAPGLQAQLCCQCQLAANARAHQHKIGAQQFAVGKVNARGIDLLHHHAGIDLHAQ